MFECFHCGERTVVRDGDFTFFDYGIEGDGVVKNYHCESCGAEIEYFISCEEKNYEQGRND